MSEEAKKIAKVTVDRGLCIGAGACLSSVPGLYELDEENKAVMLLKGGAKTSEQTAKADLEQSEADDAGVLASAQSCPVMAILLHDAEGNQIYP